MTDRPEEAALFAMGLREELGEVCRRKSGAPVETV